ncbi:MAG: hypothetical protein KDF58_00900, partial [Alphaproteobacteria bacterium]|nr:hypothetical protein [Alphaproteobacteria bacterium]
EPIAHIDLHGLQKYFAADGSFIKQQGNDNSIRVVKTQSNTHGIGVNYKNLSYSTLKSMSVPAQVATKENKKSVLKAWTRSYQGLSSRYSDDPNGDREYAMVLYTQKLTNEDGSTFDAFVKGKTIEGSKGIDGITLSKSESPVEGWAASEAIHTHRWGDKSAVFSDEVGFGKKYAQGDIQTALEMGITLYLVVPNHFWVQSFNAKIYNEKRELMPHESAKSAATNKTAIYLE